VSDKLQFVDIWCALSTGQCQQELVGHFRDPRGWNFISKPPGSQRARSPV